MHLIKISIELKKKNPNLTGTVQTEIIYILHSKLIQWCDLGQVRNVISVKVAVMCQLLNLWGGKIINLTFNTKCIFMSFFTHTLQRKNTNYIIL